MMLCLCTFDLLERFEGLLAASEIVCGAIIQ